MYIIKEIFYSIQGEGARSGRPAIFVRMSGCNLWSGLESDRPNAICRFCDTNFVGGQKFETPHDVVSAAERLWPSHSLQTIPRAYVVFTGGEPALQLDERLVAAFRSRNWEVAIETNGTKRLPSGIHWITVSPKFGSKVVLDSGDEIKIVYPQDGLDPKQFEKMRFDHFFLQPKDGFNLAENRLSAARYCLRNPRWKLSIQLHKVVGLR